jgi:hypothetical protein
VLSKTYRDGGIGALYSGTGASLLLVANPIIHYTAYEVVPPDKHKPPFTVYILYTYIHIYSIYIYIYIYIDIYILCVYPFTVHILYIYIYIYIYIYLYTVCIYL